MTLTCRNEHECGSPIPLVAIFRGFPANRTFFSITDRVNAGGVNALVDEKLLYAIGAPVTQSEVVFFAAPFVTMPFNPELQTAMFLEPRRVRFHSRYLIRTNIALVEIKIDRLYILLEHFIHADVCYGARFRAGWSRCSGNTHGNPGRVGRRSSRTGCRCGVGDRRCRSYRSRALHLDVSNLGLNAYARRIL